MTENPDRSPVDPEAPAGRQAARSAYAWDVLAVVALGGGLGSLARWALARGLTGSGWAPWGTIAANLTGALLLGVLTVAVIDRRPDARYLRPFWVVGVLGGFTTFSAWMVESIELTIGPDRGIPGVALGLGYLLGMVVLGWLAVLAGLLLGRRLAPRPTEGRR